MLACHLAVLALLALTAPVSAQEGSPNITPADPLVPNVSYSPGQYAKIEGTIVSRKGDALLVRRQNTKELSVVTLTANTEIESPTGIMNLERKKQDMAKLQAGLFLKVRGHGGDQKELVAERISFHKTALKVTNQISSGTVELKEEMDERFKANADSIARGEGARTRRALRARHAHRRSRCVRPEVHRARVFRDRQRRAHRSREGDARLADRSRQGT